MKNQVHKSLHKMIVGAVFIIAIACTKSNSDNGNSAAGQEKQNTSDSSKATKKVLPLEKIKLPSGFKIAVFAEVPNARSMALSPSGVVYVGNRNGDNVYAVKDNDGDGKADKLWTIASGLNMPNGVAFKDGALYVAEVSRILKYPEIESRLDSVGAPQVISDQYPEETHHGWKYIAFGPDGKLYVPVGAPCNICESKDEIFASITTINPDGSGREVYARGVRNTVGFTWHPQTKQLWFTDNGRDLLGDEIPSCELNVATKKNQHFGYPYCHAGDVADPEFGSNRGCDGFVKPVQKLGPHVAPLGLKFYAGEMFPEEYNNQLLIARHGSWNRTKKSGYDVVLVKLSGNKAVSQEVFASGWLDEKSQKAWGRPVDVLVMPDGSILVSDDQANVIYRITYGK